ncbi:MAG: DUF3857 and transglutaminase domain-containing protein [Candidatus Krumholzibacteriia bacterium]
MRYPFRRRQPHRLIRAGTLPSLAVLLTCSAAMTGASPAAATPAERIPDLVAAAGTSVDHDGADEVVVFDRTDVDVEDSGLSHVVQHRLVKALTAAGARRHAFQRFDYDPATQFIEVRRVRVWRPGEPPREVNLAGLVDVTAPAHAIYWGARMQGLAVTDLQCGDAVETEIYRKGFMIAYLDDAGAAAAAGATSAGPASASATSASATGEASSAADAEDGRYIPPMRGHYYDVILFQEPSPLREKTYTLRTPRDKPVQFEVYNGPVHTASTFDAEGFTYRFWTGPQPAVVREWRSTAASDHVPKVVLATAEDWPAKSRWFHDANVEQFHSTPAIDAKVAEITRGLKTDEEKIAALNHWVAQNIRYCGHNMGEGEGYTLHPGDMVFTERAGVCKDIASMSITMLRAAGYEVYPAMTMAGSRVESIPADQFNHSVAALRRPDGTWEMLDPTWIPFAMDNWSRAEGEQDFVIGTPEGEQLMRMPAYSPEENLATLRLRGRLQPDGTLVGTLDVEGRGQADAGLRRAVALTPRDEVAGRLAGWLAEAAPGAELTGWRSGDPEDFSRPLSLALEFRLPGHAMVGRSTASWQPTLPALVGSGFAGVFRVPVMELDEDRTTPALLWFAQLVDLDEEVELPRGFLAAAPVAATGRAGDETSFARASVTATADGRKLRCRATMSYQRRTIEPDRWPEFRAAVEVLRTLGETRFTGQRREG